ncbi:hypothetical protein [Archangium sp.]|uniref:hypothetical protein n=1 Tax=Archangium sp. TaxID=1872627 RepID=UPI00286A1A01|nr:hypothetical protein [Archangium sp.]
METTPNSETMTPRQPVPVPTPVRESRKGLFDKSAAAGIPAQPLLGRLPLRWLIPQDVHSLLDYQGALTVAAVGLLSGSVAARTAGLVLGSYRAQRGVQWGKRLRTDLGPVGG